MGTGSGVQVSAWVKIDDSATIDYHVFNHGEVEFSLGSDVDILATERGLSIFVDRAQEALRAVQNAVAGDDEDCPTGMIWDGPGRRVTGTFDGRVRHDGRVIAMTTMEGSP